MNIYTELRVAEMSHDQLQEVMDRIRLIAAPTQYEYCVWVEVQAEFDARARRHWLHERTLATGFLS